MTIGSSKARYSIDFFFLTIFWRQRNTWERIANFILKWLNKSSNILLLWRPLRNASVHCQNRCKEIIAFTPVPVASTAALWANVHVFLSWILKYKALQKFFMPLFNPSGSRIMVLSWKWKKFKTMFEHCLHFKHEALSVAQRSFYPSFEIKFLKTNP